MPKRALLLLVATLTLALALGSQAPAVAGARGDDNTARAVNTTDGASVFKLALSIRRTAAVEVSPDNTAMAIASCESCQTVAVALQVVLATGPAAAVEASNVAVAVNDHCQDCETLAVAFQFVVVTGGPVRFTSKGWREVMAVRRELKALRRSGLPPSELRSQVEALATRLQQAVTTELRPVKAGHLHANGSSLEARLRRHDQGRPSDRTQRREARQHRRHQLGRAAWLGPSLAALKLRPT